MQEGAIVHYQKMACNIPQDQDGHIVKHTFPVFNQPRHHFGLRLKFYVIKKGQIIFEHQEVNINISVLTSALDWRNKWV